jgi:death on curing protein
MRYVNKRMVVAINRMAVELAGGALASSSNVRPGASLGFVETIYHNTVFGEPVYPDIFHQAGAYMFHVIKNHVFLDGNKRTGLAAAITFLEWNDVQIAPFDPDSVFDFVVEVAAGENEPATVIPRIAQWLRRMSLM